MADSGSQHPCEFCGKPAARQLGERWVCDDCYSAKGSCCPEFGADDLWAEHEQPSPESLTVDESRPRRNQL